MSAIHVRPARLIFGFLLFFTLGLSACTGATPVPANGTSPSTITVVAAENFYGDIARQLGAGRVSVTSIISDPNIDPHEY